MGKQLKQCQILFFLSSKITADGDCSHEIIRHLLLRRKVMTNQDSILKSRDITLLTKVHLDGKVSVYNAGDLGSIPGLGRSLEKETATHSSTLA